MAKKRERYTVVCPLCQAVIANQSKRLVKLIGSVNTYSVLMPSLKRFGVWVFFFTQERMKALIYWQILCYKSVKSVHELCILIAYPTISRGG